MFVCRVECLVVYWLSCVCVCCWSACHSCGWFHESQQSYVSVDIIIRNISSVLQYIPCPQIPVPGLADRTLKAGRAGRICMCVCMCIYIYIYIWREREREILNLINSMKLCYSKQAQYVASSQR